MRGRATTRVSILRGTELTEYDDVVDTETVVRTRVPAAIAESNRRVFLPAEQAYRVIRAYSGQMGAEVDIRKGDRIRDERTNVIYLVLEISEPANPANRPDYELSLSRTN